MTRFHRSIRAWSPERKTAGTAHSRNTSGRVYCGYSRRSRENESRAGADSSPRAPGSSRVTVSVTTSAAASPPDST